MPEQTTTVDGPDAQDSRTAVGQVAQALYDLDRDADMPAWDDQRSDRPDAVFLASASKIRANVAVTALTEHGWGDVATLTAERDRWKRLAEEQPEPCPVDHGCALEGTPCSCWCPLHDCALDECPTYKLVASWLAERTRERDEALATIGAEHEAMEALYNRVTGERDAARADAERWLEVAHSHEMKLGAMRDVVEWACTLAARAKGSTAPRTELFEGFLAAVERYQHPAVTVENDEAHVDRCGCALCHALWVRGERTEPDSVGICGAMTGDVLVLPDDRRPGIGPCDLPAGHAGWHGVDQSPPDGTLGTPTRVSWTENSPFKHRGARRAAGAVEVRPVGGTPRRRSHLPVHELPPRDAARP